MKSNEISVALMPIENIKIRGSGNIVHAQCLPGTRGFHVNINGHHNRIEIGRSILKDLTINIGNHRPVSGVVIKIGDHFSIEPGGRMDIYTDFARVSIGRNCLFSRNLNIHYGDNPHLIFNRTTGDYRDGGGGISIGDHVWVGEDVYMTKNAGVSNDCVVAARCVLTKTFDEQHSAYGGNPARKIATDVSWFRNRKHLPAESIHAPVMAEYDQRVLDRLYEEFGFKPNET